jgi:hypothetical protein
MGRIVSLMLRPFYPRGLSTRHPLDGRLGESQGRSGGSVTSLEWNQTPIIQPAANHFTEVAYPNCSSSSSSLFNDVFSAAQTI